MAKTKDTSKENKTAEEMNNTEGMEQVSGSGTAMEADSGDAKASNTEKTKKEAKKEAKKQEKQEKKNSVKASVDEEKIREEVKQEVSEDRQELLENEIENLKKENKDLNDLCLRKQADFENFRKRMLREKEDAVRYANRNLLSDLITVIDDFERAIASAEGSQDFDNFYTGIKMIEKQFTGMLERNWGLKRMETVGEEFNPQEHEAVMMEESPDYEHETVVEDFQKGYFLHDRVLRHAKVKVAVPASDKKSEEGE